MRGKDTRVAVVEQENRTVIGHEHTACADSVIIVPLRLGRGVVDRNTGRGQHRRTGVGDSKRRRLLGQCERAVQAAVADGIEIAACIVQVRAHSDSHRTALRGSGDQILRAELEQHIDRASAGDMIQAGVAQRDRGVVLGISERYTERVSQRGVRNLLAGGYVKEQHMGLKRYAVLPEGENAERIAVRREYGGYNIVFRCTVFENLFSCGVVNGSGGTVAVLVGGEHETAAAADRTVQDGGFQLQLRDSACRADQCGFDAAAVVHEHIIRAAFHRGIGVAERIAQRGHAARTGQEQRVTVRVRQTGFKQRTVAEGLVFVVDGGDIAVMRANTGRNIAAERAQRGRRKNTVVGDQEQGCSQHQSPAAEHAEQSGRADTRVLAVEQALTALPPGERKADDILLWVLFAHEIPPPYCSVFCG